MKLKTISIIKLFKKTVIINLAMILSIVIFLSILLFNMLNQNYESRELVNVLGNQRALTQSMAKNSTRIYALIDAIEDNDFIGTRESILEKISDSQIKLINDRDKFNSTLNSIMKGHVSTGIKEIKFSSSLPRINDEIDKINTVWPEFSRSVDSVANAKSIDREVANATMFINENNEDLLTSSNLITGMIVNEAKNKNFISIILSSILLVLSFIILTISLFNLNKYIILPLDELYTGISQMNIINGDMKKRFESNSPLMNPITTEVNEVFDKLGKLVSLIENINENKSFNDILNYIYESFSTFIPYTYIGIALLTEDKKQLKASYGISAKKLPGLPENLLGHTALIAETSLGKVIETGVPRVINDLEEYVSKRPHRTYNETILGAGIKASITLPLKFNNKPLGIIFFSSDKKNVYTDEHTNFLKTITNSIAIAFQNNIFIDELLFSSILALAKLAESRDEDTGDHLWRMKMYSRSIAQFLYEEDIYKNEITTEFIDNIEKFSPLHDIGKVGIPDAILLKPGKLTPEEFDIMKQHAVYGAQVLRAADENIIKNGRSLFNLGIEIAEGHHEKWNGSGYPNGKRGEDIPLSARIVAVADVFDALTSRRPYKEPFSIETAYDIITKDSGKHFDPEIVRVFVEKRKRVENLFHSFQ
jgi:HD-GYP domain-containing protein (c-di-GMP phosphodiesterase class II)